MRKLILVFIVVFSFACGNKEKDSSVVKKTEAQPELIVTINFKSNKADEFRLMLNNIKVDEFQRKNIVIIEEVVASNKIDKLTANFGENTISKNFQIGLGTEKVKVVQIETIKLSFGKKSKLIKASDLGNYFTFNKYASLDDSTFNIITKKVNGKYAPRMSLKANVLSKLSSKSKEKK